jgi:hypothetical protein
MEKNNNMYTKAESALNLLRDGVTSDNKTKILEAYNIIEAEDFSWDNLEVIFMEWDDLIEEANNILNS